MPVFPELSDSQKGVTTLLIKICPGDHAIWKQNMARTFQIFFN
jgi:hypothetical protein